MPNNVQAHSDRSTSPSALLADLVDRLTARMQAGEPIDWDEVLRQHPEQAEELRRLRPALGVLNDLSRSADEHISGLGATGLKAGDPQAGVIGDFRVVREIGRGGMGVVYEDRKSVV